MKPVLNLLIYTGRHCSRLSHLYSDLVSTYSLIPNDYEYIRTAIPLGRYSLESVQSVSTGTRLTYGLIDLVSGT